MTFSANKIKDALKRGVVSVTFTKKDGTERNMLCTQNRDLIEQVVGKSDTAQVRQDPEGLFTVIDVDLGQWRRFGIDQVTQIDVE